MEEHPIEGLMETAMDSIRDMIDVNTIIGEAIQINENVTIIPISKVCFGFASGGSEFKGETIKGYKKIEDEEPFRADIITSRAAFKVTDLLSCSKGFYDENTLFALFKGSSIEAELSGLKAQISIKKAKERNYVFIKGVKC